MRLLPCLAVSIVLAAPLAAGQRYAFLVGVEQYQGTELRPLKYAEKDIEDLARQLVEVGYKPGNIVVMTENRGRQRAEDRPDAAAINRRLQDLLARLNVDDTLLAAFSGHGVQFRGQAESYFCPSGTDLARRETLLPLDRLYESMHAHSVGMTALLVDACRSDPQLGKSPTVRAESITRPPDPPGGVASLFSCSAGQESFEHEDLGHGVFFHYVTEGLRGKADTATSDGLPDGEVTLPELENYVVGKVREFVRSRLRREQVPQRRGDTRGLVSLASLGSRLAAAPPIAVAPFDPEQARRRQQQWADFLGTTIEQNNSVGMDFVLIPPGKFQMGSNLPAADVGKRFERDARLFEREHPQHEVEITEPFYLGKHEVTVGQFGVFVDETGYRTEAERNGGLALNPQTGRVETSKQNNWKTPGFLQEVSHPVVLVSWNDAAQFCQWLSGKVGAKCRLPTEEEWEYACRAGTTMLYSNGNAETTLPKVANLADAASRLSWARDFEDGFARTAPVGRLDPNAFGLFDMHGNAYEWCFNGYQAYGSSQPASAFLHATRGGSWESRPEMVRSALRLPRPASWACDATGFRVMQRPQPRTASRRDATPE